MEPTLVCEAAANNGQDPLSKGDVSAIPSFAVDCGDTQLFAHQVAGHNASDVAVLKHKTGFLMKPCQGDSRGQRELEFYRKIYEGTEQPCSTEVRRCLQKLTPTFFGVSSMNVNGASQDYLMLQDVVAGLTRPCVMDIKLGPITWNPNASPSKIDKEKKKYLGTKGPLGISMAGMYHFDLNQNELVKKDRTFGRTLSAESLLSTIKEFLNYDHPEARVVIRKILDRLRAVEDFFLNQSEFAFYSSSVLLAYDAALFGKYAPEKVQSDSKVAESDEDDVRVFMIDFAHVFPLDGEDSRDDNYLFGLTNVIRIFQGLLDE